MSEALFLTGRHADQLRFLADAHRRHPELRTQTDDLFSQLLLTYECVALPDSGQTTAAQVLHR